MFQTHGGGPGSGSFSGMLGRLIKLVVSAGRIATLTGLFLLPAMSKAAKADTEVMAEDKAFTASIAGSWKVIKVVDRRRTLYNAIEIGKLLVLDKTSYADPFNSNCQTKAGYPVGYISWDEAKSGFRLPVALDRYRPKGGRVADTRLTCDEIPTARVLFLPGGRAFYLAETEVYVLTLAR